MDELHGILIFMVLMLSVAVFNTILILRGLEKLHQEMPEEITNQATENKREEVNEFANNITLGD